jgi:Ca-activated chloride channel family protein
MRHLASAGLLLGLLGTLGSSAQEADRLPTISVETNLVTLPVTVVDRHGQFVPRLTRNQFSVYDNGELQDIEFFTSEEMPATIGLVIDSSSSMRGRREDVTAAATAFASLSHPLDELFTLNFNEAVWPGLPPHIAFAENAEQLHEALAGAPAQGMTALYDAVDRALDHVLLGTRDRKVLVIVSDGGDNASSQTLGGVLERARRADAVIYSVMLVDPDNRDARPDVLKKLAGETGGAAFAPKRVQDVMEVFARIAREIRSGYTIGFSPSGTPDEGFHSVRVVVAADDGRQLTVRTRAGYYAGHTPHVVR